MTQKIEKNIDYYRHLLDSTYCDAVKQLKAVNGECKDDYYHEESFNNYVNCESSTHTKGGDIPEGWQMHHIDENKVSNLSSLNKIRKDSEARKFEHQKKERLVYCDLLEHIILHALIAKETNNKFGYGGYESLYKQLNNWVKGTKTLKEPTDENYYDRIKLTREEKATLLAEIAEYMPLKAE